MGLPHAGSRLAVALLALVLAAGAACAQNEVQVGARASQEAVKPGDRFEVAVEFVIQSGFHIYGPLENQGTPTVVTADPTPGFAFGEAVYPEPKIVEMFGEKLKVYEKSLTVKVPVTVAADAKPGDAKLKLHYTYAACDESSCLPPVSDQLLEVAVKVAASVAAQQTTGGSGAETTSTAKGDVVPADFGQQVEKKGLILGLLFGFGMGILASLTPCVFPMIPVTVSFFVAESGQSRAKAFLMACVYVSGIVLTYSVLGLIVGRAGEDIGAYSADPWVVGVLVAVFLTLAVSMFGAFEIRLPSSLTTRLESAGGNRGGFLGAFILGLVLGFVAAPCVGPFAGSLIVYASTQPPVVGFLCLSTFGLGMGVPFLFVAIFSSSLVRPGAWMERLKQGSAFFLLGMAVYFMKPLAPKYLPEALLYLLAALVGMPFAAFLGAFTPLAADAGLGRVTLKALGVLVGLFAACAFIAGVNHWMPLLPQTAGSENAVKAEEKIAWVRDFEEGMALAARSKRPVFVDFTADW